MLSIGFFWNFRYILISCWGFTSHAQPFTISTHLLFLSLHFLDAVMLQCVVKINICCLLYYDCILFVAEILHSYVEMFQILLSSWLYWAVLFLSCLFPEFWSFTLGHKSYSFLMFMILSIWEIFLYCFFDNFVSIFFSFLQIC